MYKDYNIKYIYKKEIYNNSFSLKIKRSLSNHLKNESVKYTLTINSLTKETILNDKLPNRNEEFNNEQNRHNMGKNLQDQKLGNYGVNKKLKKEFKKYKIKNYSSKYIYDIIRFKNWLYRNIFKKSSFWINLSTLTGVLGAGAAASMFNMFIHIFIYDSVVCYFLVATFAGFWGVLVIIIILLIIGTWMIVTWLWQHKEVYNETCGK
ncbi:Plasmodium exported protein, unknown function [Plasmodium sp.]|nr:Plasmodium exported protein, unknown function [Plasmodium sp.]